MTLNDGDKAIMMEIARGIVKEVLVEHTSSCPYGLSLMRKKALLIGLCAGVGLGSGIGGGSIVMLLMRALGG